jgi:hypothetical protein
MELTLTNEELIILKSSLYEFIKPLQSNTELCQQAIQLLEKVKEIEYKINQINSTI